MKKSGRFGRHLLAVLGVLLSAGVLAIGGSSAESRAPAGGFLYSDYLTDAAASDNVAGVAGSFVVETSRPFAGFRAKTAQLLRRQADGFSVRREVLDYVIKGADLSARWKERAEKTGWEIADIAVHESFLRATEGAKASEFLRTAELDWQTDLGGRRANVGVNLLGALREANDEAFAWQFRAFKGRSERSGGNAGLIYRRVESETLVGGNVFLDYESGKDGNFWRWSVGGEVRSAWVEAFANYYSGLTGDALSPTGFTGVSLVAYTADGFDLELNAHLPNIRWLTAVAAYYHFEGKHTLAADNGLRVGAKLQPLQTDLQLNIFYDNGDVGNKVGGGLSWVHRFGERHLPRRAEDFVAADYFFESANREYTQRIRQVTVNFQTAALDNRILRAVTTVGIRFGETGSVSLFYGAAGGATMTALTTPNEDFTVTVARGSGNNLRLITNLNNNGKVTLTWVGGMALVGSDIDFDGTTMSLNYGNVSLSLVANNAETPEAPDNDIIVVLPVSVASPPAEGGEISIVVATMAMVSVAAMAELSIGYGDRNNQPDGTPALMQPLTLELESGAVMVMETMNSIVVMVSTDAAGTVSLKLETDGAGDTMVSLELADDIEVMVTMAETTLAIDGADNTLSLQLAAGGAEVQLTSGIEVMITTDGTSLAIAEAPDGEADVMLSSGEAEVLLTSGIEVLITTDGTSLAVAEAPDGEVTVMLESGGVEVLLTSGIEVLITTDGTSLAIAEAPDGEATVILETGGVEVQMTTGDIAVLATTDGTTLELSDDGVTVSVGVTGGDVEVLLMSMQSASDTVPKLSVAAGSTLGVSSTGGNVAVDAQGGSEVEVIDGAGNLLNILQPGVSGGGVYRFPLGTSSSLLLRNVTIRVAAATDDLEMEVFNLAQGSTSSFVNLQTQVGPVLMRGYFNAAITTAVLATVRRGARNLTGVHITPENTPFAISLDSNGNAILRLEDNNGVLREGDNPFRIVLEENIQGGSNRHYGFEVVFEVVNVPDNCPRVFNQASGTYNYRGTNIDLGGTAFDADVNIPESSPRLLSDYDEMWLEIDGVFKNPDLIGPIFGLGQWRTSDGVGRTINTPPFIGRRVAFSATPVLYGDNTPKYHLYRNTVSSLARLAIDTGRRDCNLTESTSNGDFYIKLGHQVFGPAVDSHRELPLNLTFFQRLNALGAQTQKQTDGTYKMSLNVGEMPFAYLWGIEALQIQSAFHETESPGRTVDIQVILDGGDSDSPFTAYKYTHPGRQFFFRGMFNYISFKPTVVLEDKTYEVTVEVRDVGSFSQETRESLMTLTLDVDLASASVVSTTVTVQPLQAAVTVSAAFVSRGGGFGGNIHEPYRHFRDFLRSGGLFPHRYETASGSVMITQNAARSADISISFPVASVYIMTISLSDEVPSGAGDYTPTVLLTYAVEVVVDIPTLSIADVSPAHSVYTLAVDLRDLFGAEYQYSVLNAQTDAWRPRIDSNILRLYNTGAANITSDVYALTISVRNTATAFSALVEVPVDISFAENGACPLVYRQPTLNGLNFNNLPLSTSFIEVIGNLIERGASNLAYRIWGLKQRQPVFLAADLGAPSSVLFGTFNGAVSVFHPRFGGANPSEMRAGDVIGLAGGFHPSGNLNYSDFATGHVYRLYANSGDGNNLYLAEGESLLHRTTRTYTGGSVANCPALTTGEFYITPNGAATSNAAEAGGFNPDPVILLDPPRTFRPAPPALN